ncbi:uncharacterized [Tachysurus ichikawai]
MHQGDYQLKQDQSNPIAEAPGRSGALALTPPEFSVNIEAPSSSDTNEHQTARLLSGIGNQVRYNGPHCCTLEQLALSLLRMFSISISILINDKDVVEKFNRLSRFSGPFTA